MKKKLFILGFLVLLLIISLLIKVNILKKNTFNENNDIPKDIKQDDMLSMMLETKYGSGEYEMTTASSWPSKGYIFNTTISKCENGSVLSWNETTKSVTMTGNMSDKCYIYFDKVYNPPVVESSEVKTSDCSSNGNFTLKSGYVCIKTTATAGDSPISKYYFSIDGGNTYVESTDDFKAFLPNYSGEYGEYLFLDDFIVNIKTYVVAEDDTESSVYSFEYIPDYDTYFLKLAFYDLDGNVFTCFYGSCNGEFYSSIPSEISFFTKSDFNTMPVNVKSIFNSTESILKNIDSLADLNNDLEKEIRTVKPEIYFDDLFVKDIFIVDVLEPYSNYLGSDIYFEFEIIPPSGRLISSSLPIALITSDGETFYIIHSSTDDTIVNTMTINSDGTLSMSINYSAPYAILLLGYYE